MPDRDRHALIHPLQPSYPHARAVALRVQAHIAHQGRLARDRGEKDLAPEADLASIEAIIDAAFWASLRGKKMRRRSRWPSCRRTGRHGR